VGQQFRDSSPQALPVGFLYAGAASVVSTLWHVDDRSTEVLMTEFHRRLQTDGEDRWQALRAAKLAVRAATADPFHWAAFLGIGLER
jgi:CHAT domain-containing protein